MEQMTAQEALESVKGITFEKAWAIMQEDRRKWEAEQRKKDEQREKEMAEMNARMDKKLGWLSNSLGELTEAIFSGSLYKKFKEYGYNFMSQAADVEFVSEDEQCYAEVDMWLEGEEYAMAVEIKTKPRNSDIDEHIKRIGKIRKLKVADKRTILGAIAGGVFRKGVKEYAHRKGLYVIVQSGESVAVQKPPKSFEPGKW